MSNHFKTALGPIPIDWDVKAIGELAVHVGSGITPTGGSEVYTDSGVVFIRSQNVTNEGLLLDDVAFINQKTHASMKSSEVVPYDVLLNITGASIGRCCYLPPGLGQTNVNQHVCAIRLPIANCSDAKYLSSVLSSPIGQNQIFRLNAGGKREGLNYQQLRLFRIPWPSPKQRAGIARILTTQDNLIEKTEALIAKYQAMKQGMMHDLFTRGVDEHGHLRPSYAEAPDFYKQSELGWIPKEWTSPSVGQVLVQRPKNGYSPKESDEWTGTVMLGLGCLTPSGFEPIQLKHAPKHDPNLASALLKDGDLLISRSNTRELVALVGIYRDIGIPCIYSDLMMRLVPTNEVLPD